MGRVAASWVMDSPTDLSQVRQDILSVAISGILSFNQVTKFVMGFYG